MRAIGNPAIDLIGPMPYLALQTVIDESVPDGRFYVEKSGVIRELTDEAIGALAAVTAAPTAPFSVVVLGRMGGAVGWVPKMATAFAHRDAADSYTLVGAWDGADRDDAPHIAWVRVTQ